MNRRKELMMLYIAMVSLVCVMYFGLPDYTPEYTEHIMSITTHK